VTPFVLRSSSQYRPKSPYALTSKKYAADFNEVKALGRIDSTTRTAEQTEIALFCIEGSPQGWNRIARIVSAQRGLNLWENARLFGLLNLASADAYIADFENKFSSNSGSLSRLYVRPTQTGIPKPTQTRRGTLW